MTIVQQQTTMNNKVSHFVMLFSWYYDNVTMLYNDVCTLVEHVQQELCNDFITMYNVT